MKRLIAFLMGAAVLLLLAPGVLGQDILVPAGTLLQCTMEEPNFSSATASVGDPVLCHLRSFQEFGRPVFPRGSMLAGHLEADKEPGHFVGKGYLKITFDRVIVPSGDIPVPAKVIQAKGYKVDKQGDVKGKGHATRDVVEWMIPPLWPWKVLTLPARGPRPTLKGEEPLELRLMDDIVVPRNMSAAASFPHLDRPPYASSNNPKPATDVGVLPPAPLAQASLTIPEKPPIPAPEAVAPTVMPVSETHPVAEPAAQSVAPPTTPLNTRITILVLKSNQQLEVTRYHIDSGVVAYQQLNGTQGAVDAAQIDWRRTTQMTAEVRSVDLPLGARQTN
jgi:hypothetical protein